MSRKFLFCTTNSNFTNYLYWYKAGAIIKYGYSDINYFKSPYALASDELDITDTIWKKKGDKNGRK